MPINFKSSAVWPTVVVVPAVNDKKRRETLLEDECERTASWTIAIGPLQLATFQTQGTTSVHIFIARRNAGASWSRMYTADPIVSCFSPSSVILKICDEQKSCIKLWRIQAAKVNVQSIFDWFKFRRDVQSKSVLWFLFSWFHGRINRLDAEKLLRNCKAGSYLVRHSETNQVDFALSLK